MLQLKQESTLTATNTPIEAAGSLGAIRVMELQHLSIIANKLIPEEAQKVFAQGQMRPTFPAKMSELGMIQQRMAEAAAKKKKDNTGGDAQAASDAQTNTAATVSSSTETSPDKKESAAMPNAAKAGAGADPPIWQPNPSGGLAVEASFT